VDAFDVVRSVTHYDLGVEEHGTLELTYGCPLTFVRVVVTTRNLFEVLICRHNGAVVGKLCGTNSNQIISLLTTTDDSIPRLNKMFTYKT